VAVSEAEAEAVAEAVAVAVARLSEARKPLEHVTAGWSKPTPRQVASDCCAELMC